MFFCEDSVCCVRSTQLPTNDLWRVSGEEDLLYNHTLYFQGIEKFLKWDIKNQQYLFRVRASKLGAKSPNMPPSRSVMEEALIMRISSPFTGSLLPSATFGVFMRNFVEHAWTTSTWYVDAYETAPQLSAVRPRKIKKIWVRCDAMNIAARNLNCIVLINDRRSR